MIHDYICSHYDLSGSVHLVTVLMTKIFPTGSQKISILDVCVCVHECVCV